MSATPALQHEQAPPNPELKTLNPKIAAVTEGVAVVFPTSLESLREHSGKAQGETLVAGVSSFGYAGTIAHALLGQAPVASARAAPALETQEAIMEVIALPRTTIDEPNLLPRTPSGGTRSFLVHDE